MKHLVTSVTAFTLTLSLSAQNPYMVTYMACDIRSDISCTALPGNSTCAAQLTVNVRAGETINSSAVR